MMRNILLPIFVHPENDIMKILYISTMALVLWAGSLLQVQAQHLQRRPFLGVQLTPVPDSIAVTHHIDEAQGAFIAGVIPNSTAAALKLQAGDVILRLDGKEVSGVADVVAKAKALRTGETVTIAVNRKGRVVTARAKVQPQPKETVANGEVLYDEVPLGNNSYARSILKKPKGKGRFPALYFIQGYNCGSIDNLPLTDPTRRFVDAMVERGYVVYRVEKPGAGDSSGTKPCAEIGFHEEVAAFTAGLKELKTYDFVDIDNIFLFGHSLGANVAPLVASAHRIKGIVGYGVNGKPWFEYLLEVLREQRPMAGADYVQVDEDMRVAVPLLYALMIEKEPAKELAQNPAYRRLMEELLNYDGAGHMFGRSYRVLQELQEVEVNKAWKDAATNTLMIYGGADFPAIDPDGAKIIVDVVNAYHPGKGTYKFLPGTDHSFIEVGSKQDLLQLNRTEQYESYASSHFNYKLVDMVDSWMKDCMKVPQ